ncbi:cytochrome c family protein [Candidatus Kuenenia stuttgartiensis]|uniref:Cytochrome c family protein n=1 Tax=Kuenenia stuttgartiensis TaxID=174633 RepID=Q1Q5N8_KUEST|nr:MULTISPECIES: multiheme c-type cytochrome [Kuenenia]MBE7549291.1 hypothetical protein [Planctomycetia bacterium]MBZ0193436.1 cytochrome c family protein [Candidatus Kuenenia stuttgartiensis]MCF6150762.1 hypothetical protein [Candidatus Kuenenia stuttgartiensis]MCL4727517.1 cytochrome c family protein [Candidatus Kuenenia stuttgartiensis]MCZ7624084.1 cytochrome c family protein [Candidatus Kuenenia sp.]
MSIQRLIFFVFSSMFFISTLVWFNEEFNPEWKKYQEEYYKENAKEVEREFNAATSVQEREMLGKRLTSLKSPKYEVKQILLKGDYAWTDGKNGDKVDRCITCHIDERKLVAVHPNTKYFPSDIYGCTVCHGGIGRALNEEMAHEGMVVGRRDMLKKLKTAEPLFEFWDELATLTPEENDPNQRIEMGDFKRFCITGDKNIYVGSDKCLKCHTGLTSPHVERWQRIKFKTFEKVKKAPDYIAGNEAYRTTCFKCHTTGYDADTGTYSEEGVTCEACHGAGETYAYFMEVGKAPEGQKIAKIGTFGTVYNICGPCHHTRAHEMRLKFFQEYGKGDEWFFPEHTEPYKTTATDDIGLQEFKLPKIN